MTNAPPKIGRPIDAVKQQRVLGALSADPHEFSEIGVPPYSVGFLAQTLEIDPSNLRKLLLRLESDGLVVSERRSVETWNAISQSHMPKKCLCFWNAATMQEDKVAADEWRAGLAERSAKAFARLL